MEASITFSFFLIFTGAALLASLALMTRQPLIIAYIVLGVLIAYLALSLGLIGTQASTLIQATAILTFLVSSYIVVLNYPTPIAISDRLRRD